MKLAGPFHRAEFQKMKPARILSYGATGIAMTFAAYALVADFLPKDRAAPMVADQSSLQDFAPAPDININ